MKPETKQFTIPASSAEELEAFFQNRDNRLSNFIPDGQKIFPLIEQLQSIRNRYSSQTFYAQGGSKDIFKVFDKSAGRFIAMACLREEFCEKLPKQEQFLREARITSFLSHPNIMPIYNIGFHDDKPFFTMKLIEGDSLSQIIRELRKQNPLYRKKYSLNNLIDIFVKVCDAVAYAHSRGIIHLDLKPDNIRVNSYGEVLVCDWGIARLIGQIEEKNEESENIHALDADLVNEVTVSGIIKGTPGYMAPEQIKKCFGSKTVQTDIYALGSILYSLLTFHSPLDNIKDVDNVLDSTIEGKIPPPSSITTVPGSLDAICGKAMSLSQNKRYGSVTKLLTDLQSYQHGFITAAENNSLFKILHLFVKRHKTVAFFLTLITISTTVFMFNLYQKEKIATRNLNLYQQEREVADYFNAKGFNYIFKNFKNQFGWESAADNLKIADYMLAKNPDNQSAMGLKGLALFALQDYKTAQIFLKKSDPESYEDLIQLCEKQLKKVDYLEMLRSLYKAGRFPLARQSFEFIFNNEKRLDKKEEWLKELIVIFNKKVRKSTVCLSCRELQNNDLSLSITAPEQITNLDFLRHLPITTLKINNITLIDFSKLTTLPIKRLNIVNSRIKSFDPLLKMPKLRFLIMDYSHKLSAELRRNLKLSGIEVTYVPAVPKPPQK